MATLRKASTYSKMKVLPFTRISRKKSKSYIKVVPPQKIVKFTMGDSKLYNHGAFPHVLSLVSTENVQIRHNALEACRQCINRLLDKEFPGQFYFRVIPFPHHIQRENKMLTGAGADRMQTGMQMSFGKSVGKAALVKKNHPIFVLYLGSEKAVVKLRECFRQIKAKLPCKTKVVYEYKKSDVQEEAGLEAEPSRD